MSLRISLAIFSLFATCCHSNTPANVVWHTEKEPIIRRLPFLNEIETCWWVSEVATDGSRGAIPAPSSSLIRGYVKVSPKELQRLMSSYEWNSFGKDEFQPLTPPSQHAVPPMSGRLMKSEQLMRSLVARSTFRNGVIVLAPDNNVMYFDLAQD